MTGDETAIVVDDALRLKAPRRERGLVRLAVAALIALAIDAGAVWLVWSERMYVPPPATEDIPVEIVVLPPPPPTPSPSADAQPQRQPEDLRSAQDAPREGKADHDDEHVAEKEKPAAAPPPPEPTPSPEASKPAEPPPAPEVPKAAEADLPPPQESPSAQSPEKAPAAVAALPQTFDQVPDIDFGGEAMKSPVTGGKNKTYYTSQLYGLIYARLHVPGVAHSYGRTLTGAVSFAVDGRGRLTERFVSAGSGSMELDEAVMQAIASASRYFPKPPKGVPVGLTFTYSVN